MLFLYLSEDVFLDLLNRASWTCVFQIIVILRGNSWEHRFSENLLTVSFCLADHIRLEIQMILIIFIIFL